MAAEYLAAEVVKEHGLPTPLTWIEYYPEHEGEIGEFSLVKFSSWEPQEVCLGCVAVPGRHSQLVTPDSGGSGRTARRITACLLA
jgi:hypothetical protein